MKVNRVPGKGRPVSTPTNQPEKIDAPEMVPWEDERMLPSLLLIGPSGSGKSRGIAQLCEAGFRVALQEIEPKAMSIARNKPLRIQICAPVDGRPPTPVERYQRLVAVAAGLEAGKYRTTPDGEPIDLLASDGLTEAADLTYAYFKTRYTKKDSLELWTQVGTKTLDQFRCYRDAAGVASTRLGLPPIGIVCTCLEVTSKKLDVHTGKSRVERDQPALQGQMALPRLASLFEVVWRLDAGTTPDGMQEFRVHTVLGDTFFAKSPPGLFPPVVTGPGGPGNDPDIGKMYRELISNPASPYYDATRVEK